MEGKGKAREKNWSITKVSTIAKRIRVFFPHQQLEGRKKCFFHIQFHRVQIKKTPPFFPNFNVLLSLCCPVVSKNECWDFDCGNAEDMRKWKRHLVRSP